MAVLAAERSLDGVEPGDCPRGGRPPPRRCRLLGDKQAVRILFSDIAPRFADRPGGYTRVLRLAKPRLGDAGIRAILELVGVRDRKRRRAAKPAFEGEPAAARATPEEPAGPAAAEPAAESK